jgi:hypothetical protein
MNYFQTTKLDLWGIVGENRRKLKLGKQRKK